MAELAFDLVESILVRLDAEDLIRCKSVCKSWQSLISSPPFVKHHLNHASETDRNNPQLGHRRIGFKVTLAESTQLAKNKSFIVGSCNGLVCVSTTDAEFVVTNPLTRQLKRLPKLPCVPKKGNSIRSVVCWGFGYDSSADDYKVVVGFRRSFWKKLTQFHVLTLKSNSWKAIGEVKYLIHEDINGVLCGGALHWFMSAGLDKKKVIISLDLSTDELREIPQPTHEEFECVVDDVENVYMLGVVEECLCLYEDEPSPLSAFNDLAPLTHRKWVMKNNKWEIYNDDNCESKYDVAHMVVVVVEDSFAPVYGVDDGKRVPSAGRYMCASIFVKSLVSPHPHPPFNYYEGHVKGHEGDESGAKVNKRKRKRNKSSYKHKKQLVWMGRKVMRVLKAVPRAK